MRVQLLSDLHFEFHHDQGASFVAWLDPTGVDVLVLAGDVAVAGDIPRALRLVCRRYARSQVLYVHGNHEYYGATYQQVVDFTREAASENGNLRWLDSEVAEIDGLRFLGTTLWFRPEADALVWRRLLNDFERILDFDTWLARENRRALDFLHEELRAGDVVISHHLPIQDAVAPEFQHGPLCPFFVCDVEPLILEREPRLWFFGHSHRSHDSHVGRTWLASNPFGYAAVEENRRFDWSFVLDL
jgi:predicted MPP superfamily phosphohydrolase